MRLFCVLLLCLSSVSAQGYDEVVRFLTAGDSTAASSRFVSLLSKASDGEARSRLLDRAAVDFRDRGATAAWLQALDALIASSPRDVTLLWFRASTAVDLKLLRSARTDLEAASKLMPGDAAIAGKFAAIAGLTWDYETAAKSSDVRFARHHRALQDSLDEAATHQAGGLVLGVLVLGVVVWFTWRSRG